MPAHDLSRIISAARAFLQSVRDHNTFNGKLGYDPALGAVNLANEAAKVGRALENRSSDDPESKLGCDMLSANVPRLSIEPANPYLLEIVEQATASLERVKARCDEELAAALAPGGPKPDDPRKAAALLDTVKSELRMGELIGWGWIADGTLRRYKLEERHRELAAHLSHLVAKPAASPQAGENEPPDAPSELPDLVTLDQAAAAVHRRKRTLERRKTSGSLTPPSVEGGGGRPDLWDWSLIRPWLVKEFGVVLPERFPRIR